MAEFDYSPPYDRNDLSNLSDVEMMYLIKTITDDVIVENGIYYEGKDRLNAIETIYPVISIIVFNSNFSFLRRDKRKISD